MDQNFQNSKVWRSHGPRVQVSQGPQAGYGHLEVTFKLRLILKKVHLLQDTHLQLVFHFSNEPLRKDLGFADKAQ